MAEEQTGRSKTFIASIVFIALIVVGAMVVLLTPRSSETESTPTTNASPESETVEVDEDMEGIDPSVCGLAADPDMSMETPPQDAEAVTVGLVKVPGSDTFGPGDENTNVPTCWQYSEAGAVSAAYTFMATATDAARLTEGHLIEHLSDGPGRDEMLGQLEQLKRENPEQLGTTSAQIKPVGYRVLEFGNGQARIDVLVEHAEAPGEYAGMAYQLVWEDGDWKLEVTQMGENYSEMRRVPDPSDFVMWEMD